MGVIHYDQQYLRYKAVLLTYRCQIDFGKKSSRMEYLSVQKGNYYLIVSLFCFLVY